MTLNGINKQFLNLSQNVCVEPIKSDLFFMKGILWRGNKVVPFILMLVSFFNERLLLVFIFSHSKITDCFLNFYLFQFQLKIFAANCNICGKVWKISDFPCLPCTSKIPFFAENITFAVVRVSTKLQHYHLVSSMWYISTCKWVLRTPFAGWNIFFLH